MQWPQGQLTNFIIQKTHLYKVITDIKPWNAWSSEVIESIVLNQWMI